MSSDSVEIRRRNGEIDEIIIRNGDIHIEQMSSSEWYMGVNASDGAFWQFWFGAKNGKTRVEFQHIETIPSTAEQHVKRFALHELEELRNFVRQVASCEFSDQQNIRRARELCVQKSNVQENG